MYKIITKVLNKISKDFKVKLEITLERKLDCKVTHHQSKKEKNIIFHSVKNTKYVFDIGIENYADVMKYIKPAIYYEISKVKKNLNINNFYINFGSVFFIKEGQSYYKVVDTDAVNFLQEYNKNIEIYKETLAVFYPFFSPSFPFLCFKIKSNEEDKESKKYKIKKAEVNNEEAMKRFRKFLINMKNAM